jgi:hypothetical protein
VSLNNQSGLITGLGNCDVGLGCARDDPQL